MNIMGNSLSLPRFANSVQAKNKNLARVNNTAATKSAENSSDIRKMLSVIRQEEKGIDISELRRSNEAQSARSYSESLRVQRQQAKDTSLKLKKLKYHFKDISSKILRSKTSASARQVASQAKREVIRLKRERDSGMYDSEEIEAALSHAKSMEIVARKKVKHLEEEEMAKASGGICAGDLISGEAEEIESEGDYSDEEYISDEMAEEFADAMEELFENMEDLTDSLMAPEIEMDPEDLDSMRLKHRNKEMKEIVEADSEYLKAMFNHFEKMKAQGFISSGFTTSGFTSSGFTGASSEGIDVVL